MSALRAWLRAERGQENRTALARRELPNREPEADVHVHGRDCECDWMFAALSGRPVPTCGVEGRYPWPGLVAMQTWADRPVVAVEVLLPSHDQFDALLSLYESAFP